MDLRDQFAVHFASVLAGALIDPAQVARRSYDFAEAMLAERARRIEADETRAAAEALPFGALEVDASEQDEVPYDPTWDIEPRWSVEEAANQTNADAPVVRPGLARTQPSDAESDAPKVVVTGA